jgi:hypothetical protein
LSRAFNPQPIAALNFFCLQPMGERAFNPQPIAGLILFCLQPMGELERMARDVFELTYDLVVLEDNVEDIKRKVIVKYLKA